MADAKNSGGIFFTDPSTKEKETDFDFTGTAILAGYKLVADASASSKLYIGGYKKVVGAGKSMPEGTEFLSIYSVKPAKDGADAAKPAGTFQKQPYRR
jgi:hypothetical protein